MLNLPIYPALHNAISLPDSAAGLMPCDSLAGRDGKWRPVEPGTFPLANGATDRVGRLRAYGNGIVPQVAAEVIIASNLLGGQPI